MAAPTPFACVVAGRPPAFLAPVASSDGTPAQRYTLTLTQVRGLNHLCVFTTEPLPSSWYAAVYFLLPSSQEWKQLGALTSTKPSAIFALKNLVNLTAAATPSEAFSGMATPGLGQEDALLGIMLQEGTPASDNALVLASTAAAQRALEKDPMKLATAVARNLFDYLSGFAKALPPELTGGNPDVQVVELSAISRYIQSFEAKIRNTAVRAMQSLLELPDVSSIERYQGAPQGGAPTMIIRVVDNESVSDGVLEHSPNNTEHARMSAFGPHRKRFFVHHNSSGLVPLLLNAPERSPSRSAGYGALEDGETSPNLRSINRNASYFHVQGLVDDRGGNFEKYRLDPEDYKDRNKRIRLFYDHQNVDSFAEVDSIIDDCTLADGQDIENAPLLPRNILAQPNVQSRKTKIQIAINFLVNILLLAAKIVVTVLTGSISVLASTVDSTMDLLSTLIIAVSNYLSETDANDWKGEWDWPTGRRRMEPMGVVIFSVAMIASFVQVFIESVQRLAQEDLKVVRLGPAAIATLGLTIVVKLVMWLWCRKSESTSVQALAQDAENDVVFNFFSIVFPFAGSLIDWGYLDPLGGALLSVYIIKEWMETLISNTRNLTGKRASPAEHQRVCYLLTRFSPLVKGVQHIEVYSAGDDLIVESDIILPADLSLPLSHNVGESIQLALESLSRVSRAYVHLDFQINPSSHQRK